MDSRFKTLRRIARKEIWGVPLLILSGWMYAILSLLFDCVLLNNWSPYWLLIFIVTFGIVIVLAVILKSLVLDRFEINSATVNVFMAGILGIVKNLSVGFLATNLGLDRDPLYPFRVLGGFGLGAGIFWFCGLALGARAEHNAIMTELHWVQESLMRLRSSSKVRLAEVNDSLARQTREVLLPKLGLIQNLLQLPEHNTSAIESLRVLIRDEVRPLSEALSFRAVELVDEPAEGSVRVRRFRLFQPLVGLRGLLRPNAAAISLSFSTLALAYMILGAPECNNVFYASLISWGLVWVAKVVIPRSLKVTSKMAVWSLFVISFAMAVPPYAVGIALAGSAAEQSLFLAYLPISMVSVMAFAFSESLDQDRVSARAAVEAENQALAHDQALFEQQLWLGRRAWQFVVHGTVQAALTAALTRLQASPEPERYVLNMVADDIERARQALVAAPVRNIDLAGALGQLQATWRGICEIQVSITERAGRSLQKNNDARVCVNEIVKETVSNAVRHGEAKRVWVEIDRQDDFALSIRVSNDGLPLSAQSRLGVGSRLIEELTTDWSLETNQASGRTVFNANLPLQRT